MAANGTSCRSSATAPGTWSTNNFSTSPLFGGNQMDTGKSALGLDGNVAAALGYPIGIIAIISLIMEKENRFVKFHALQSILLHVGAVGLMIALWVISAIVFVGGVAAG